MRDPESGSEVEKNAAAFVRRHTDIEPEIALILGSGLGALAEAVEDPVALPYADIPGFPTPTVEGHSGRLILGRLSGRNVVVVQGRLHRYEGWPLSDVVLPVRVAHRLGATRLFVTNAAGGIRTGLFPGALMWIVDHIDWTGSNLYPVVRSSSMPSPPDIDGVAAGLRGSSPYDLAWTERAAEAARLGGIATERGTYLWTLGPSYETQAEIRCFRKLGADVVGMSTVPEVAAAHHAGMRVAGLSTVTNLAAGLGHARLDHSEVIETGRAAARKLATLACIVVETAFK